MQIDKHAGSIAVDHACKLMNVSRSGYYDWKKAQHEESRRQLRDKVLLGHIKEIFELSHRIYGARRIQRALKARNIHVSRKKVSKLMVIGGLHSVSRKRRKARTTKSNHIYPISENLLSRNFERYSSNEAWVTDTTYIGTGEGWLYLTVVIDLYSRQVVGYAMGEKIDSELAIRALNMALVKRRPKAGLIVHSDRGSQFASHDFREALSKAKAVSSMSRKGDCYDNACAESFFHSLKVEWVYPAGHYPTRKSARDSIMMYLLYYNRSRLHSSLGYVSPCVFEKSRNNEYACPTVC